MTKRTPKEGEYWVVTIQGALPEGGALGKEVVWVGTGAHNVYGCASDEPWPVETSGITFIRRVRL